MRTPKLPVSGFVLGRDNQLDCYSHPLGGEELRPRRIRMRRLQLFTALFVALASGLALTTSAMAYDIGAVYRDCNAHGKLTGHYSRGELQAALNQMPSEVAEYSACANIIQHALLDASSRPSAARATGPHGTTSGGKGGGPGSGPGGKGPTSGASGKAGGPSATNGGGSGGTGGLGGIGGIRAASAGTGGSLPAPLIVVLILLALTALSGAGVAIRRRVVARHGT